MGGMHGTQYIFLYRESADADSDLAALPPSLAAIPSILYIYDLAEQRMICINSRVYETLGYHQRQRSAPSEQGSGVPEQGSLTDADALLGRIHPDDMPQRAEALSRLETAADGDIVCSEYRIRHADGRWLWLSHRAVVYARDPAGAVRRILVTAEDITGRKQGEEELRRSEERLIQAQDLAHLGYIDVDVQTHNSYWSDETYRILGLVPGSAPASYELFMSCVHPEDVDRLTRTLNSLFARNVDWAMEYRIVRPNGEVRWVAGQGEAVYDRASASIHYVGVMLDITERKEAERALWRSQEQMAAVTEAAMDAMITIDEELIIRGFNRVAETVFHYRASEVQGQPVNCLLPQRYRNAHANHIRRFGQTGTTNRRMNEFSTVMALSAEGVEFPIEASISQVELEGQKLYTVILRDISDRKRLEAQLMQAQKMEGIGRLAGGIAHDFNNLLTAILGYAELAVEELDAGSAVRGYLENIQNASERAAGLTSQLLAFARKQIIAPRVLSLNGLVQNVYGLLRRLIGEDIEIVTVLAEGLWSVKADAAQFEQALVNLAVNARDAMPEGGKLTIETVNVTLDADYIRVHPEILPGDYVMLGVSDTGVGMSEAIQQHIFEPFFTTKGPGKGTGLGLATCHGVVKQNGGHIWLYSEPGVGTTFKIFLPRSEETAVAPLPAEVHNTPRGTETILVVEDEPMVRSLAVEALRLLGYRVLEAGDGMAALQIAHAYASPIHLLLTDVIMPQMSGRQLAERIQALRPEVKVLYVSGYTDNTIVHHGVLDSGMAFLQKPYSPLTLANKIREVLEQDSTPS
jgi:two-component system cell cycle sensor histidine kinase/response regulator CckA